MDIYEALDIFYAPSLAWTSSSSPEEIAAAKEHYRLVNEAEKVIERYETYRSMTAREGRALALTAFERFDAGSVRSQTEYTPHEILGNLAKNVPGSLAGLYQDIIERELYWDDGVTFREADPATRDLLLSLLENESLASFIREEILCALAWIDDETVLTTFQRWQQTPPSWTPAYGRMAPFQIFTQYAGWELSPDGQRRDLCHQSCYELVPIEQIPTDSASSPLNVFAPTDERCHWCGRPLVALFDCDLRDKRLAFLDKEREWLRILACPNCSVQDSRIITDIDASGNAHWSKANGEADQYLDRDLYGGYEDHMPTAKRHLVLGPPRKTPYETIGLYWHTGLSQIGGYPEWVQYPEYPLCPDCQQTMKFVGQLEITDMHPGEEGMLYAFFCAPCGKATTAYQQT